MRPWSHKSGWYGNDRSRLCSHIIEYVRLRLSVWSLAEGLYVLRRTEQISRYPDNGKHFYLCGANIQSSQDVECIQARSTQHCENETQRQLTPIVLSIPTPYTDRILERQEPFDPDRNRLDVSNLIIARHDRAPKIAPSGQASSHLHWFTGQSIGKPINPPVCRVLELPRGSRMWDLHHLNFNVAPMARG